MRKKLFTLILVVAFISAASFSSMFYVGASNTETISYAERWDLEGIDGTPNLEGVTFEGIEVDTGNTWTVWVSDDYNGGGYYQDFECVLSGEKANIWIGLAPDVWDGGFYDHYDDFGGDSYGPGDVWYFAYPWTNEGILNDYADPSQGYYLQPGYHDWITYENLEYVIDEFDRDDDGIHDKVVEHFGEYAERPGPLDDSKIQVLIFNMRDGLFFDPENAPWFIMGYFWSYISELNEANIFHMDTYQWWRRLGDNPVCPVPYQDYSPKPNQYEGTFAHEFQHLVHYDLDGDELSWVNEGCSTLAEWLCGYGFSPGHISEYLLWHWDTSLVIWEGYLANYGGVFLWTFYMYEHYGGADLIKELANEPANGIEGWNNVLAGRTDKTFDEIFQDWAIANYMDDVSGNGGIYGYYALDIPSADSDNWDIPSVMEMWEDGNPDFFDWIVEKYPNFGFQYAYDSCLPYVVNYVEFYKKGTFRPLEVSFNGDDVVGVAPHAGSYEWYSDQVNAQWFRLGQEFTNIPVDASLTFWSHFEIEADWDYGYVEVHDLTTGDYTTLQGVQTVTTLPEQQEHAVCPEYLLPKTYFAAGNWNAFTGSSSGWYQESMDLSAFAGHDIELHFTYWTDPYTVETGWYVDDIEIAGVITDDVEGGQGAWEVNDGWAITTGFVVNAYTVNFIEITNLMRRDDTIFCSFYNVESMTLDPDNEEGSETLWVCDLSFFEHYNVMVIANQPGFEHTFKGSYTFEADFPNRPWKWKHMNNIIIM